MKENNSRTYEDVNRSEREFLPCTQPEDAVASQIARGVARRLRAMNQAVIAELALADGRRCDLIALDSQGTIAIVEIKSSVADFRADHKWPDYLNWCDRFYFAVGAGFPLDLIPEDCGLILADRFGAEILRDSPEDRLGPARRKAITLRFARAAAFRLHDHNDPESRSVPLI